RAGAARLRGQLRRRAARRLPFARARYRGGIEEGSMSVIYHEGNPDLQQRFDTTRIADRIEEVLVSDVISDHDRAFIESRDMFFLATADDAGLPNCSYKCFVPGFVPVIFVLYIAFLN